MTDMPTTDYIDEALPKPASRVQKTIALTLASLFTTLVGTALSIVLPRILSLTEIAGYKQTILAYQTLVPILGLGITQGIYYSLSRNEHRQRAVTKESILILFSTGLLYSIFIFAGGRNFLAGRFNNPAVADLLLWMAPLAMFAIPATIRGPVYVYREKVHKNAIFSALTSLFCVLCVFVAVLLSRTSAAAVASYSLSHIVVSILGLFLVFRMLPKTDDGKLSSASVRSILSVSLPLGIASMLGTLSNSLDKWFISFMRNPEEYAVFSYGAYELPFLSTIAGAISTVIIVDMVKHTKARQYNDAISLFRLVAKTTSYFIFPLMMLFMVIAEPFFRFMFTDSMLSAVPVFRVYLLILPIRTVMYGPLLIALGKSKQVMYKTLVGLLSNLLLSVILVWWIGSIGATVATVITLYAVNVPINLVIICRQTNVSWKRILPFRHYGKCLLSAAVPAAIGYMVSLLLAAAPPALQILAIATLFILFLIPMYFLFFKTDMKLYWHRLCDYAKAKLVLVKRREHNRR